MFIDPSGKFIDLVRDALTGKGGALWVWGTVYNGKSTLKTLVEEALPEGHTYTAPFFRSSSVFSHMGTGWMFICV